MKPYLRRTLYSLAVVALFGAVLVSGCADSFVAENTADEEIVQQEPSKLRHWGLVEQAKKQASKDGENVRLILTLQSTADSQDILERFAYSMDILERFGLSMDILERFGITTDILERFGLSYDILERFYYDILERFNFDILERFETVEEAVNALIVEMPPEMVDFVAMLLERYPEIKYVEPDILLDPTAPLNLSDMADATQITPWGLSYVGADQIADRSAEGVEVYLIDTGISNDDVNVVKDRDFTNSGETSAGTDKDGHGTHIAGLVGAIDDGDGIVGVAPGARIHNLRVAGPQGEVKASYVLAAIDYVVEAKKADPSTPVVLNISLGADVGSTEYTTLDEAVEAAVDAGIVVVVAAGNAGIDAATVTPAHAAGAITVGAYGQAYQFASFSNHGAVVDLLAPGVDLVSLAPEGAYIPYSVQSGTSMAAGVVTGAVAVSLAQNPTATPAQIEQGLKALGRAEVYKAPTGTTNKSVWIGGN